VNWIKELLKFLDLEGEVQGAGDEERVGLIVEIKENAGRFIGRRGMTLGAIRHLLHQSLSQTFGDRVVDVSIPDRRERSERPERSNSERRDRKGRGGKRGSDRGGRSREGGSRISEEKLQALARRAADKAKESGQTITIKLELNSYDRRVVHLEISEIDGVETQSKEIEGEDGETMKVVQIVPSSDD
jgi:predicted RNA-binding protein Jag